MPKLTTLTGLTIAVAALAALGPATAVAAVPTHTAIEGVLLSSGGGPAADGNYTVTVGIYSAETGGNPVWAESGVTVSAKSGQFSYQLGAKTPLSASALNLQAAWVGIQIGSDPELPRKPLGSAPFALRAGIAEALECTGCLKAGNLDAGVLQPYAKSADLGAYAKTADLSAYAKASDLGAYAKTADLSSYAKTADLADYVKASALAKVAGSGSYNDLKDLPTLAKVATSGSYADLANKPVMAKIDAACGTNLVLKGIKADGSYDCTSAGVGPDMINEVSNDLIWNQFVDSKAGATDMQIKDGFSAGVTDTLAFPDVGLVQKIWVDFSGLNSDMSKVIVELYGPGMGSPYILYNGGKTGTVLTAKYNDGDALVSGDMNKDWLNKNIKGNWSITVKDIAAIQVPPGTPPFTYDGKFNWSVSIQTLSSKKIQIKGNLIVDGSLSMGNGAVVTGDVTFKDKVDFQNSWCPSPGAPERSLVLGGVCVARVSAHQNWPNGIEFCNKVKADLCSSAQSYVIRRHGALANYTAHANWTNSYADNDGGEWYESVGSIGDDHSNGTGAQVPCCYNVTPKRSTDEIVKINSSDVGVRVVYIHNTPDKNFGYAATFCASMNADLCSRSEYVVLRTANKIANNFLWSNSGDDTDSQPDYTSGNTIPDNVNYAAHNGAFACCAGGGDRSGLACPAGSTEQAGICVTKVNNSGTNWVNAARDCATKGGHICTVSQNYKLRSVGYIVGGGTWSSNMEDCDGSSGSCGNGSVGDNINPGAGYTYACCL